MSEEPRHEGFGQRHLLTVIAEGVIEERLLADLRRWGVRGLTTSRAEGDPFGSRAADIAGAFVRMECIVPEEVSMRVLEALADAYFGRYKVIAYDHPFRIAAAAIETSSRRSPAGHRRQTDQLSSSRRFRSSALRPA